MEQGGELFGIGGGKGRGEMAANLGTNADTAAMAAAAAAAAAARAAAAAFTAAAFTSAKGVAIMTDGEEVGKKITTDAVKGEKIQSRGKEENPSSGAERDSS